PPAAHTRPRSSPPATHRGTSSTLLLIRVRARPLPKAYSDRARDQVPIGNVPGPGNVAEPGNVSSPLASAADQPPPEAEPAPCRPAAGGRPGPAASAAEPPTCHPHP